MPNLALSAEIRRQGLIFHLIVNAYWEPLDFELPLLNGAGNPWRRWVDTFLDTPDDIVEWQAASLTSGSAYRTGPRSVVVLFANLASAN
jgi:isoamylase